MNFNIHPKAFLLAVVGVAVALMYGAAHADNYVVKDANGVTQTFGSKSNGTAQAPTNLCATWQSGNWVYCHADASGNLDVNVLNTPTVTISGTPTVTVSGTVVTSFSSTPTVNLGTIGGAATAANQTTGNSSLSTLAGTVSAGNVNVVCTSGCSGSSGSNAAAGTVGSAVPSSGSYTAFNFGGNLKGWVGDTNGYGDVNVMNSPTVNLGTIGSAASAANQTTGNNSLSTIATNSTTLAGAVSAGNMNVVCTSGCAGSGGGGAVTMAAGAMADGASVTLGTKADAAWVSGSGSEIALLKNIAASGATGLPASSATIGNVGQSGVWTPTNIYAPTSPNAVISVSSATTTQIIAAVTGKAIYVSNWTLVTSAADNITWEYGTGTNCGTNTATLTGAMPFGTNTAFNAGSGTGPVLVTPLSTALCIVTSTTATAAGSVGYTQQ